MEVVLDERLELCGREQLRAWVNLPCSRWLRRSTQQEEHWRDHNNVSAVGGKERWA